MSVEKDEKDMRCTVTQSGKVLSNNETPESLREILGGLIDAIDISRDKNGNSFNDTKIIIQAEAKIKAWARGCVPGAIDSIFDYSLGYELALKMYEKIIKETRVNIDKAE